MTLSEELVWRGFIQQSTFTDLKDLDKQTWTFYHGFDASADSQTIGNLAGMMLDKLFIRHGSKAILLAGGATSLIGDPGGKDKERPLQTEETIAHNVAKAEEQIKKIFVGQDFTLVNNLDWTKDMTVLQFLRDIGKNFSMTPLVQRDYIAQRIGDQGAGISFTEFSYTILQGYDYLHLFEDMGANLQLGGSDQWGNLLSGVDLIRRVHNQTVHALTMPLIINKATGKKFGKSEDGAVWLDPTKTTPTQFYQFWINADDQGVEDYLKIFTELEKETIERIMAEHNQNPQARVAQKALADAATELVHGKEEAENARMITAVLTGQTSVSEVSNEVIAIMRTELPHAQIAQGSSVIEALVSTSLAPSNSEARRLIAGNAVYINGQPSAKENFDVNDFQNGRLLLRRGKALKDTALIELS